MHTNMYRITCKLVDLEVKFLQLADDHELLGHGTCKASQTRCDTIFSYIENDQSTHWKDAR